MANRLEPIKNTKN